MKIKSSVIGILLSFAALHSADVPQAPVVAPDAETGAHIPPDNYYSSANLARLTAEGERKHAPLAIIVDQENIEAPAKDHFALTLNFAYMLQTAFVPMIVSRSIVYNYFFRRNRAEKEKADFYFIPENNPVSFNKWHAYHVPLSQFFLFVPNHYIKHYENSLGLNLSNLTDISKELPTAQDYEAILDYICIRNYDDTPPFSINNLRTILTTIKQTKPPSSGNKQLTKADLKQQDQLPIWDVILHGHGSYKGNIGGIPPRDAQELLTFFNNELPVGLFYIESCSTGGENLNLLEFDKTIDKPKRVLRNLDYILVVGSVTDKKTFFFFDEPTTTGQLLSQLYSDAAQLQGKGKSLDTLLNNLNKFYRHSGSPHGTSNIPQVWLPGGLGFQTYQINKKVQIVGNVKVRTHEQEQRPIILPDSSLATLVYTNSIEVPILVMPHVTKDKSVSAELDVRTKWNQSPNLAESLFWLVDQLEESERYPALTHILKKLDIGSKGKRITGTNVKALKLLYPEFISMLRGNLTKQYFSNIELLTHEGEENELTGVMHFIRDAFFDIGGRSTTKIFLIEELIGNNDLSALLELSRLSMGAADSHPLEEKLTSSIGKQIKLQKVAIVTDASHIGLGFIFDDTSWLLELLPESDWEKEKPNTTNWRNFSQRNIAEYTDEYEDLKKGITPEKIGQKSISDILHKKSAALKAPQKQK